MANSPNPTLAVASKAGPGTPRRRPLTGACVLVEVADIWMIRKMLLNLRDRAQAAASDPTAVRPGRQ